MTLEDEAVSSALLSRGPGMKRIGKSFLQACADVALAGWLDLLREDRADLLALLCEQHASNEAADTGVARLPDGLELAKKSAGLVYAGIILA